MPQAGVYWLYAGHLGAYTGCVLRRVHIKGLDCAEQLFCDICDMHTHYPLLFINIYGVNVVGSRFTSVISYGI